MPINRANLPQELLADIKDHLQILWDSAPTDNRVTNIVVMGMVYLNEKLGVEADYTQDGLHRNLLFEYARYARDGATDVFENNYLQTILAARDQIAVERAMEKGQDP